MPVWEHEDKEDEGFPNYWDRGRIFFYYCPVSGEVEIIDFDGHKAPFWLHDQGMMDYTVRDIIDLDLEGHYVIEGVYGEGHADYFGEYDEDWFFSLCRRASEEEIKTGALQ